MTCTCLQKFCLKMHIYCLKTTNVKLVQIFLQYLNLTKQLPMLNINKHGIRKIKRNVLNTRSNLLKNLNIKNLIENMHTNTIGQKKDEKFPPNPPSTDLCQQIVSDFCADTSPEVFEESGCAVCGKLTPICEMEELSEIENVSLLKVDGVTRKARCKSTDPVRELKGPILAPGCSRVCPIYVESLEKKKVPTLALANGLWVGEIPDELQDLTYAEQLLIARVRHNRCIVKVSSGMSKMRANAISFSNPMPKIYNVLPPPIEEMDEVLAFIYTGPCKPTKADFQRTPLLVRRLKVSKALHWLKLNHVDYYDCEISDKN